MLVDELAQAVAAARPDIVVDQLTDLPSAPQNSPAQAAPSRKASPSSTRQARARARKTIRWTLQPWGVRQLTIEGIVALEREVLQTSSIDGVVLRYGYLYGPNTWYDAPRKPPSVHVDAAAQAALLAVTKGEGIYNVAEDDGAVSGAKARRELDFDPASGFPDGVEQPDGTFVSRCL